MTAPNTPEFPRLAIMADPDNAGRHPYHDSRWIVTEGAQIERGHDDRSWGIARHTEGYLVAEMRDLDPKLTAEIVRRFNAAPAQLEALQMMMRAFESLMPGLRHIAVQDYALLNDAPLAARKALAEAGVTL